ncbi:MFS transporter [Microbispora cellulosiformans]|uniref:MFS transporter n=1 Tax=Microbispora cellulosiformans TaxID=2614688 RepID=A0A5J5K2U8_9ACTN|nr:MDR family MFS transporter [Microbispora cellulosiformans]KAA9378077.1 MFS transporter [Microbispora cellulosiformans]
MSDVEAAEAAPMAAGALRLVFGGILLCLFLSTLDQTVVATALYGIIADIGRSSGLGQASWIITAYLLTSIAATPLYGRLSDLYGRKPVYLVSISVFMVGSILCGLAGNMPELIVLRGLQGIGAGGLQSLAFVIVGDVVAPRERARFQTLFFAVFTIGGIAGPLIGGLFVSAGTLLGAAGWRWIFFANIPFSLTALALIGVFMRLPRPGLRHKIDVLGAVLVVAGVVSLLLVSVWGGQEYAWSSPQIIGLIVCGLLLLAAFVWWERRASEPILPMHLFRDSIFTVSSVLALVMGVTSTGVLAFLALYLEGAKDASPTEAGLGLLPLMLGLLLTSFFSARLIAKTGRYRPFPIAGFAVSGIGMVLLSLLDENTSGVIRSLYLAVVGMGMGLGIQVLTVAVQNSVERKDMGVATAAGPFFRAIGGSFGTALFGAILTTTLVADLRTSLNGQRLPSGRDVSSIPPVGEVHSWPAGIRAAFTHALTHGWSLVCLVAAGFLAAGFVLSWFLKEVELGGAPAPKPSPASAKA